MATIENKKNQPLNVQTGTIPDVSGSMRDWFQPLTFIRVEKSTVAFQLSEELIPTKFWGVLQFSTKRLEMKGEGQRAWNSLLIYADPVLALEVDDIIEYNTVRYRVLNLKDYQNYGYIGYELVEDWKEIPSTIIFDLRHTVLQYGLTLHG